MKNLNYKLEITNIDPIQEYGLRITQCGRLTAFGQVQSVPHIYDHYVLSFVIKGEGTYIMNGIVNPVKVGDAFLTAPNVITSWTTNDSDPIQYIFMIIGGPDHLKILSDVGLGLKSRIFQYRYETDQSILEHVLALYHAGRSDDVKEYELLGYLYLILNGISKQNQTKEPAVPTSQSVYFQKAAIFISNNYSNDINVLDIANFLNIDRTYLYKIFKNEANISPITYLTNFRLEKAKWMLEHSDFSNADIAIASGFYDYSHFSHVFKKKFALTPKEFRNRIHSASMGQAENAERFVP